MSSSNYSSLTMFKGARLKPFAIVLLASKLVGLISSGMASLSAELFTLEKELSRFLSIASFLKSNPGPEGVNSPPE